MYLLPPSLYDLADALVHAPTDVVARALVVDHLTADSAEPPDAARVADALAGARRKTWPRTARRYCQLYCGVGQRRRVRVVPGDAPPALAGPPVDTGWVEVGATHLAALFGVAPDEADAAGSHAGAVWRDTPPRVPRTRQE